MIVEEEEIQSKKIKVLKEASGKKNALGMAEGTQRHISTFEVVTFVLFTFFLMICVITQLNISSSYATNKAIEQWMGSASFFNGIRGKITLDRVRDSYDYYGWLDSLLVHQLY